jgi:hypothetical protein
MDEERYKSIFPNRIYGDKRMSRDRCIIPSQHPFIYQLEGVIDDKELNPLMYYCREITMECMIFIFPYNIVKYDIESIKRHFRSISIDYIRESIGNNSLVMIDQSERRIIEEKVTCYFKKKEDQTK